MRSARILVVADEVNARTSVVESLRADGHDIEVASDAKEALGRRDTFSPHVVVVDFDMRGIDGLVEKLRSNDAPPSVVVLTGHAGGPTALLALRAGAAATVSKPLDVEELSLVVRRAAEYTILDRENRDLRGRLEQVMTNGMPVVPGSRLDEIERYVILETLKLTRGSTSKAAEMLGISVRTIQYRLHDYNATTRSRMTVVNDESVATPAAAAK